MTDNVVKFTGITRHDIDPQQVLDTAKAEIGEDVLVIGYDTDGDFFFTGSMADGGEALWLLQMATKKLLEIGDPDHGVPT